MADSGRDRLYLVDGTAQLFRAYFAIRGLSNAEGLPTNAVFGFTTMLRKLIQDERPERIAVAWDLAGDVFRNEQYADYKANRPPVPEDLNVQFPYAKEVCASLGIPNLESEGYEADDLIATYTRLAREAGIEVVVVASDKDLLQLVGDGVSVLNPSKNLRLDPGGVVEQFGVPPERVRDVLGLMGDSVDNIPGVPGVGEKTAVEVVSTHGDLEAVLARAGRFCELFDARDATVEAIDRLLANPTVDDEAAAALSGRLAELDSCRGRFLDGERDETLREHVEGLAEALDAARSAAAASGRPTKSVGKPLRALKKALKALDRGSARRIWYAIRDHADQARMSLELATLHERAPADHDLDAFRLGEPDRARAHRLFRSLGFGRLTDEFAPDSEATTEAEEPEAPEPGEAVAGERRYETVLEATALERVVAACRAAGRFAVDTETDDLDPLRARLVGLSLACEPGRAWYVPVGHRYLGAPVQLSLEAVRERLSPLLAEPGAFKIAQNLIYDDHVLRRHGMAVRGWGLDTMVAAFLLNSDRSSFSMDSLAEEYLGETPIPYSDLVGKGKKQITLDRVEVERVTEYAAEDADVTFRLADRLEPLLEHVGLRELYDRIDGPLLPLLAEMEAHGIAVDTELLAEMSGEMATTIEASIARIHELAGRPFNVDSPKQLREVLFDELGLKPGRKTVKSKVASTDARTLEELAEEHAIAGAILEYRELAKLKSTYVDALPRMVHPETGRVHTSYNPTGAATGRLSSSDPNLQNIPARKEAGRRIRAAFVAEPGYTFLASDYSQVELRVLAHVARDPELIEAFRGGEDIHRYTAARVAGVPLERVTTDMRRKAKAVNFGILYGMSETRLAREQGMSRDDARAFIEAYFERFSHVRGYIEGVREQVLRDAAVRTLFGRVRYFPQLHRKVHRGIQEQAYRAAVNTTIQGTAADLMKLAMLAVHRALEEEGTGARMLLQVHDELLIEVRDDRVEAVRERVRRAMEEVHPLSVPLAVDQKTGPDWLAVT